MPSKPSFEAGVRRLGALLTAGKRRCATAESCTGGMIGAALTSVPGSSHWFLGGVIAYDNRVKKKLLGVPAALLKQHGAVSAEVVAVMAHNAAKKLGADCAIAVSGIAGPGGGSPGKPVGLVYTGIYCAGALRVHRHRFRGSRAEVRRKIVARAIAQMIAAVRDEGVSPQAGTIMLP